MKEWLRKWLGIEDDHRLLRKEIDSLTEEVRHIYRELNKVKTSEETIRNIEKLISHFQLGVDVHPSRHGDSWAVFCIGGKMEYVRFVRLPYRDIEELSRFIKRFPASREDKFLDLPYGLRKEMFEL